jgi:hypothetical protein
VVEGTAEDEPEVTRYLPERREKIAEAMAGVLGVTVLEPEAVDTAAIADFDLVGFGSGIFGMAFHRRLHDFVRELPRVEGGRAFVFATRGGPKLTSWLYTRPMERRLRAKSFEVLGTFSCPGFDTWLPLRFIGGLNKGRPNAGDLDAARAFAASLVERTEQSRTPLGG